MILVPSIFLLLQGHIIYMLTWRCMILARERPKEWLICTVGDAPTTDARTTVTLGCKADMSLMLSLVLGVLLHWERHLSNSQ